MATEEERFPTILASSINRVDHFTVFDKMIKHRLDNIDLTPLLMYLIDIVPVVALPYLAEQFDLMGFNGWGLTRNEEERRNLIKQAIELKRFKGTPWAIENALKAIGFARVEIQEGIGLERYDGSRTHNGSINYGGGSWANFRVNLLDLGESRGLSMNEISGIREMINRYKNTRSHLLDMVFAANVQDDFDVNEEFKMQGNLKILDKFGTTKYYDGSFNHNGTEQYSNNSDELYINIETNFEDGFSPSDEEFTLVITPASGFKLITTEEGTYLTNEFGQRLIADSAEGTELP